MSSARSRQRETILYKDIINTLYCMGFASFIIFYWGNQMHGLKEIGIFSEKLLLITIVCSVIKIFTSKFNCYEWGIVGFFIFAALLSWKYSQNYFIITNVLLMLGLKDIDFGQVLKVYFFVGLCVLTVGFTYIILNEQSYMILVQNYGRAGVEYRVRLSSSHPNTLYMQIFALTLTFCYVYYKRMKWYHWGMFLLFNIEALILTKSRTGFLCCMIVLLLFFLLQKKENIYKVRLIYIGTQLINLFCIVFSVVIPLKFDWSNSFLTQINKLMTFRISEANAYCNSTNIPLLGAYMPPKSFDMGLLRFMMEFGVVIFILMCIGILLAVHRFYKNGQYAAMIVLSAFVFYTVSEKINYIGCDFRLLFVGYALLNGWQYKRVKRKH